MALGSTRCHPKAQNRSLRQCMRWRLLLGKSEKSASFPCKVRWVSNCLDHAKAIFLASISLRSSPIRLAIARLDTRFAVDTPVTSNSTRPDFGSNTLIISDPSGLTVQVQQRGRKPHSMMWRSSRVEIMTFVLRVNVYGFMSLIIVSPHHPDSGCDQLSPDCIPLTVYPPKSHSSSLCPRPSSNAATTVHRTSIHTANQRIASMNFNQAKNAETSAVALDPR